MILTLGFSHVHQILSCGESGLVPSCMSGGRTTGICMDPPLSVKDRDFLELFAGKAEVSRALREVTWFQNIWFSSSQHPSFPADIRPLDLAALQASLTGASMDVEDHPEFDLTSNAGFASPGLYKKTWFCVCSFLGGVPLNNDRHLSTYENSFSGNRTLSHQYGASWTFPQKIKAGAQRSSPLQSGFPGGVRTGLQILLCSVPWREETIFL